MAAGLLSLALAGCGPHAHIPPRPLALAGAVPSSDSAASLAHMLAPVLYIQRDEWFPLERVVAVVHPTRPIIAYHLLWQDDVTGSWIPFTVPTDEEVVWVGYDPATKSATDLWTYWHGKILHSRASGPPEFNIQWGKHGSIPRGALESDLPALRTLNSFWAFTYLGIPDALLGRLTRPGPICFCHGYKRYRDFSRQLPLRDRLDAIVRMDDAREPLAAVFGRPYSKKIPWPQAPAPAPASP